MCINSITENIVAGLYEITRSVIEFMMNLFLYVEVIPAGLRTCWLRNADIFFPVGRNSKGTSLVLSWKMIGPDKDP